MPPDDSPPAPLTIVPAHNDWAERIASAGTEIASADRTPLYGPADSRPAKRPTYDPERYNTFGKRVGAVKWEFATAIALLTVANLPKDLHHGSSFHFHDEGLFGHDTDVGDQPGVEDAVHDVAVVVGPLRAAPDAHPLARRTGTTLVLHAAIVARAPARF